MKLKDIAIKRQDIEIKIHNLRCDYPRIKEDVNELEIMIMDFIELYQEYTAEKLKELE